MIIRIEPTLPITGVQSASKGFLPINLCRRMKYGELHVQIVWLAALIGIREVDEHRERLRAVGGIGSITE